MNRLNRLNQRSRYAIAVGLIVLGFACAAVDTDEVGGALATVSVALGMVLLVAFLLHDLGLSATAPERRPTARVPSDDPPPLQPQRPCATSAGADPRATPLERRRTKAPRLRRIRGDRHHLD